MPTRATMIDPERQMLGEVEMVGQDRWEEIHRRAGAGARFGRLLAWTTARRCGDACDANGVEAVPAGGASRHATGHARGVSATAGGRCRLLGSGSVSGAARSAVRRQLRNGEAVRAAVAGDAADAAVTRTRFETPPGLQSQIDWGQARVWLGAQRQVRHIFVLTLGYSRRSVWPCLTEALGDLLDARASVHALRWPHPGALRPAADGVRTRGGRGAVEHDVQGVR